jgi:hypothetical protein
VSAGTVVGDDAVRAAVGATIGTAVTRTAVGATIGTAVTRAAVRATIGTSISGAAVRAANAGALVTAAGGVVVLDVYAALAQTLFATVSGSFGFGHSATPHHG